MMSPSLLAKPSTGEKIDIKGENDIYQGDLLIEGVQINGPITENGR